MSTPPSTRGNFLLHVHPDRVRARTLAATTTLGLGVVSMALLAVLLITGVVLMFWYVPQPGAAYDRMIDLSGGAVPLGGLVRDLHRLASDALVVVAVLHMARVYLTGALDRPRRINWLVGVGLLLLVVATAFTGYLLPWDREAYWAATVGGELIGLLPGAGAWMRDLLWGADRVGEDTLLRAFALHVAALPLVGALLMGYHLWRIRRAGGLARPRLDAGDGTEELVPARPDATSRELALALATVAVLLVAAMACDAPLGLPGDPPRAIDPAKAPWFLLWVQELVSASATVGGAVPLVLLALLAVAPWLEKRQDLAGRWFPAGRRGRCAVFLAVALAIVALTLVASLLRGPGWRLVW
jgi:quinol-cytochrome oxidoreductase complex cytochrome b subunit